MAASLAADTIRLTSFARCAGCAAKLGATDLAEALGHLPSHADPRLLVGRESFDDAGVFLLREDLALVQTVDFFAPIVDDPYEFGQIAAANALSDVFAMGGEPITALAIVGFPAGKLPLSVLSDILRGGQDKVREAGASLVGGHTIIDEELKFGLSVTGQADPRRLLTNAAAHVGDVLVLTKPLGTGLLATAGKQGILDAPSRAALHASMCALNAVASRAALALDLRCATDVTGFGLFGHALHIARASNVTVRLDGRALPELPGARDLWRHGIRTGGAERNEKFAAGLADWSAARPADVALALDPQTSGGLLVAMPAGTVEQYLSAVPGSVVVGSVEQRGNAFIVLG
ncbi:MAG: Selenide, water dikinase SelD [Gemmatimonadetes bacterium]|nr:Selenide, water dikinase SelD [Gemmatimonadota bacterium]